MKNIAVIAPHPDDETLGCGGTIIKHRENGDFVCVLFVTCATDELRTTCKRVTDTYGVSFTHLDLPEIYLDTVQLADIVDKFTIIFRELKPDTVYLPGANDVHSDHRIVFNAAWSCCKTFRFQTIKRVLMYETISETDYSAPVYPAFTPNVFSCLTNEIINKKLDVMELYGDEMSFPRDESNIIALARIRGAQANTTYAESFVLLKEIQ